MTGLPPEIASVDTELARTEGEFLALARKRADLLERKLAAFDKLLRERQKIQGELEQLKRLLNRHNGSMPQGTVSSNGVTSVVPGEFEDEDTWSVWKAVREILRREHREMFTGELVTRLKAGSRKLSDKTPSSQVNASIRDMDDVFYVVKHRGKAKWGLVEWRKEDDEGNLKLGA